MLQCHTHTHTHAHTQHTYIHTQIDAHTRTHDLQVAGADTSKASEAVINLTTLEGHAMCVSLTGAGYSTQISDDDADDTRR